jgi:hypothetical protein
VGDLPTESGAGATIFKSLSMNLGASILVVVSAHLQHCGTIDGVVLVRSVLSI